jgi:hypothetical protein
MIIWALVFGMSLTLSGSGKLDAGAQVEGVFKSEQECKGVKAKLDLGSKEAVAKGQVQPEINSFGATCVPVILDIHNKRPTTGA